METAVEKLRWERRRKLQVREAFARGLEHFRSDAGDPLPFYQACAAYLVTGQRRLIEQDRRLADLLGPRVPAAQAADHDAIAALRERLDLAQRSLDEFAEATEILHCRGPEARSLFEAAAVRFLDVLVNVLGARSHSLRHLTTTLFSEDDWAAIVGLTSEVLAAEAAMFAAVQAVAPAGLDPALMSTEPRRA
jgi:hypothetical protein